MTIITVKLDKCGVQMEKSVNLIESLRGSGWSVLSVSETQEPQVILGYAESDESFYSLDRGEA